ncbi:MAG: winged helix-turn-helix domain-containing protein [Candidatus Asgardarchaeia archaeon]
MNSAAYIEKLISGVDARVEIIKKLLEGGMTGTELKDYLESIMGNKISDTMVYYNLGKLAEAGIVEVSRKWREKIYSISLRWIQAIREYFKIKVPYAYIGGFESEVPFSLKSRLYNFLGKDVAWFILIVAESMRNKVRLTGAEIVYVDDSIWDGSVYGVMEPIRRIVEDKLKNYDLVVDVTYGNDVTKLALLQIAWAYNLKCFRYERGRYVWLRQ